MDKVECRLQVDSDNGIPLSLGHAHHQSVFGDTGIVDQHVNRAEIRLYLIDNLFCLGKVSGIAGISLGLHAESLDFCFCSLSVLIDNEVGKGNVCALLGKFQRDSFTDTACCTCNQCSFTC